MAKKKAKKNTDPENPGIKLIRKNKKAFHRFEIFERLEAGMVLLGTEVKSLREGNINLDEAYCRLQGKELWLVGARIAEYERRGYANHDPARRRKLLVHRRELERWEIKVKEKGLTLIPLSIYFKRGRAKLEIGLGRGRKLYDKRESLKKRDASREIQRALGRKGRGA